MPWSTPPKSTADKRAKAARPLCRARAERSRPGLEDGGDEDQAIAALLHDVVEDCGGAPVLEEIRHEFGERVARIVGRLHGDGRRAQTALASAEKSVTYGTCSRAGKMFV